MRSPVTNSTWAARSRQSWYLMRGTPNPEPSYTSRISFCAFRDTSAADFGLLLIADMRSSHRQHRRALRIGPSHQFFATLNVGVSSGSHPVSPYTSSPDADVGNSIITAFSDGAAPHGASSAYI